MFLLLVMHPSVNCSSRLSQTGRSGLGTCRFSNWFPARIRNGGRWGDSKPPAYWFVEGLNSIAAAPLGRAGQVPLGSNSER